MLEEPETIKIDDKEYKVEGFTQEIQKAYEKYMHRIMLTEIQSMRQELGDDYLPLLDKHVKDRKRGFLYFGGEAFLEFIQKSEYFIQLLWFCMSKHEPAMPRTIVENWVKDRWEDAEELWRKLYESKKV